MKYREQFLKGQESASSDDLGKKQGKKQGLDRLNLTGPTKKECPDQDEGEYVILPRVRQLPNATGKVLCWPSLAIDDIDACRGEKGSGNEEGEALPVLQTQYAGDGPSKTRGQELD